VELDSVARIRYTASTTTTWRLNMSIGGIIFMIFGWGLAFSLLGFCLYKIMKTGNTFEKQ